MSKLFVTFILFLIMLAHSIRVWEPALPVVGSDHRTVLGAEEMTAEFRANSVPAEWQDTMLRIAWCESRFQPSAIGDNGEAFGLFQLHELWFVYFHVPDSLRLDPATNIATALNVVRYDVARGYPPFAQWSCQ